MAGGGGTGTPGADGDDGRVRVFAFRTVNLDAAAPATPATNQGAYTSAHVFTPPTGWFASPQAAGHIDGNDDLYVTSRVADPSNGVFVGSWDAPYRASGKNGADGADGTNGTDGADGDDGQTPLFIYRVSARATVPATPTGGTFANGVFGSVPADWSVNPPAVDTATQDLYFSKATGNPNDGIVSAWSTPRRFSGRDGAPGTGGGGGGDGASVPIVEELTYTLDPVQTATAAYQNVGLALPAGDTFVDGSNLYFDIQRSGVSRQRDGVEVALADLRAATSAAPLLIIRASIPAYAYAYMDANNNIFWQTRDGTGTNPIDDATVTLPTIRYSVNTKAQLTLADNLDETSQTSIAPVSVIKQGIADAILASPDSYIIDAWIALPAGTDAQGIGFFPFNISGSGAGTWDNDTQRFTSKPQVLGNPPFLNSTQAVVYDQSDLPADAATSQTHDYYWFSRRFRVGEALNLANPWFDFGRWNSPVTNSGGGGSGTDSYPIQAWIGVPKLFAIPDGGGLTSAGVWNNVSTAPRFTTKPTKSFGQGTVYDISDLPADAASSTTNDFYLYERIFTVGESGIAATAWKPLGLFNHRPEPRRYWITAYLRVTKGFVPGDTTGLTSAGVWSDGTQRFTSNPTENAGADGAVFGVYEIPDDAYNSTQYDYWEYGRYFTYGEHSLGSDVWDRIQKITQGDATPTDPVIQAVAYFYTAAGADRPSATDGTYDRDTGTLSFTSDQHSTGSTHIASLPSEFDDTRAYWRMTFSVDADEKATFLGTAAVLDAVPAGGGASLAWTNLNMSATNATGLVTLTSAQIANRAELSVAYGTAANIGGGTDDHGSSGTPNGNSAKVFGTNINLALIPPYNATNAYMTFGGFGRGAQQYVVQAKRTSDGGLTLEAIDNNDGTNDYIYAVFAR